MISSANANIRRLYEFTLRPRLKTNRILHPEKTQIQNFFPDPWQYSVRMLGKRDFEKAQVKNRAPAAQQITAEQILREAVDGQLIQRGPQKVNFANEAELNEYRMGKRKEFEDHLRRLRNHIGTWIKYAKWEVEQQEFRRARSIFERALQVDYQNVTLWLQYIEMEISQKFVQHARTLYDRVTTLLPRMDQFWYKYAYMEERLENYAGARAIYEKWMGWEPSDNAWLQYVKFEERCGEVQRARQVFERYLQVHQNVLAFTRYAKFEERHRAIEKARAGYETCMQCLDQTALSEEFFIKYAQFEARQGATDRATRVFKVGMEKLAPDKSKELYSAYVKHTKQTGSRDEIEDLLLDKRRAHYERIFATDPTNLDVCFDYIRMEEEAGETERVRELYERSIARIPALGQKKYWRRYIYLWLFYAQFEEGVDPARARDVYVAAGELFELVKLKFSKLVKAHAEFEIRQLNLVAFREVVKAGLTSSRKPSVARFWIETELKLSNVSQARSVAAKLVELNPSSAQNWVSFADLELALGEPKRAAAVLDMALRNNVDAPEEVQRKMAEIDM